MSIISILILIVLIVIAILLVLLLQRKGIGLGRAFRDRGLATYPIYPGLERTCNGNQVAYLGRDGILGCWTPDGPQLLSPQRQPYIWSMGYECPQGYALAPGYDPSFGLCMPI